MTHSICSHGYASIDDCDTCLSFSHTDLDEIPESQLVLVPMTVLREMERLANESMPADLDSATLDRFASIATILEAVLP